jgi:trehalose-6-phosphate synthase
MMGDVVMKMGLGRTGTEAGRATSSLGGMAAATTALRVLVVVHRLPLDPAAADDCAGDGGGDDAGWGSAWADGARLALRFGLSSQPHAAVVWVGWPGVHVPPAQQADLRARLADDAARPCVPVCLEPAVANGHYHGYCKHVLWPLLHYHMDTEGPHAGPRASAASTSAWAAYRAANEAFAAEVVRCYTPGTLGLERVAAPP